MPMLTCAVPAREEHGAPATEPGFASLAVDELLPGIGAR